MRLRTVFVALGTAAITVVALSGSVGKATSPARSIPSSPDVVAKQMGAMPLAFTKNEGQWDERVLFRTGAGGATVWFCRDGIYYQFMHWVPRTDSIANDLVRVRPGGDPLPRDSRPDSVEMVVVKAAFVQANPAVEIAGTDPLVNRCNYFLGNDPSQWRIGVPNFAGVVYRDLYPGIDVHFEDQGGLFRTRYEAKPGANLTQIQFRYDGNAPVTLTAAGELMIAAPWGPLMQPAPVPQDVGSMAALRQTGVSTYGLQAARPADITTGSGSRLVLVNSTFLGGGFSELGWDIAVDASGSAYVTGQTQSGDFPTQNSYDGTINGFYDDVFVTKLTPAGNALVYSTFLGGSSFEDPHEVGYGIAVDADGSAYVTGTTSSADFPTQNPYDGSYNGGVLTQAGDAFVVKLAPAGNALEYSTFLGGNDQDIGGGIAVDASGSAYVRGRTYSPNFPTQNPYDGSHNGGGPDVFVTKFTPAGNALEYSTFLGGSSVEDLEPDCIAVDGSGSAYVTGRTNSTDFPTQNPYDGSFNGGNGDVFVAKFAPAGNALEYSTFLGGSDFDEGLSIAADHLGSAYVTGRTNSTDFPTQNPYDGSFNGGNNDVFVTKLAPAGNTLEYSTFLGGGLNDYGLGIAVDASGSAYVTGRTNSTDFPTQNAYDGSFNGGNGDVFVAKFAPAGNALEYSTFLGGSDFDEGLSIAADHLGSAYVTGETSSSDFPMQNPYDGSYNDDRDVFVTKLTLVPCVCDCHADPQCDSFPDVLDVVNTINVAFRGFPAIFDPNGNCPYQTTDVDCSGDTGVLDVVHMINVAFRGMAAATEFCVPCP